MGRSLVTAALVAVFLLTACSGELADTSAEAGSKAQEQPQVPATEPGIIYADFPESVTAVETLRPEQNKVAIPVGTLTIHEVEVVETVPAAAVDIKSKELEAKALPAEGEIFRILNLGFASDEGEKRDNEGGPYPILALHRSGEYIHLSHLVSGQEHRILISIPEDEQAYLIVSFEGQEQFFDAATGERLDAGHAAARTAYEAAGYQRWPVARYFKDLTD